MTGAAASSHCVLLNDGTIKRLVEARPERSGCLLKQLKAATSRSAQFEKTNDVHSGPRALNDSKQGIANRSSENGLVS